MGIMRTKSVEQSIRDTEEPEFRLKKSLGALDLVVFGIGVIIGTGIFVLTGVAAANNAGPAIALSFVVSGVACALAALCYAEFASTVPVAGSAYTFSYAALGEFIAWLIGWDLILEFTVGAATVSVGWAGYFTQLLNSVGIQLPTALSAAPEAGGIINLPAIIIALLLTVVLVLGITLSSRINQVIVAIKLVVIAFVILFGFFLIFSRIGTANWSPFVPQAAPPSGGAESVMRTPLVQLLLGIEPTTYGFGGIIAGAAIVFFAYIGFDIVATTAEEARNPQRDMPIGIIGSLALCTILYILVSLVVTGMVPFRELGVDAPVAFAFSQAGYPWAAGLISIGALAGLTTVVMILMLGQSRVFFAMSRDRLLPVWFSKVHPQYRTPYRITIITGIITAIGAGLLPLSVLAELVNIGTLSAFVLVSIATVILRRTRPDLPRTFRVPLLAVVAPLAVLISLYLMLSLPLETWIRFLVWMVVGVFVYFLYSRTHSRVGRGESASEAAREV
jgi:APA family basic amino acid/polyamine antiporter